MQSNYNNPDEQRSFFKVMRGYDALKSAIILAGGSPTLIIPENLIEMSAFDLLVVLSKNNITFKYTGEPNK